jgi:hypothetical protein
METASHSPRHEDSDEALRFTRPERSAQWVKWLSILFVFACCACIFWLMHPDLIFRNTTTNGGDMGAHVWSPAYLRDVLLPKGQLFGWTMDYYGGFPAGQFYFPIPSLMIVALGVVMPYNIAFKLITTLGPVSFPFALYWMGRGIGARRPAPLFMALMAVGLVTFTGDQNATIQYNQRIMGVLLQSTLAGEYSFAIALSFAALFIGALVWSLEHHRRYWLPAVLLALVVMSHIVVAIFAVAAGALFIVSRCVRDVWSKIVIAVAVALGFLLGSVFIGAVAIVVALAFTALRLRNWTPMLRAIAIAVIGGGLTALWSVPLLARFSGYTTNLHYAKITSYTSYLFPSTFWWAFVLGGIAVFIGIVYERRSTLELAALAALSAVAFVRWPELHAWNLRLLPFWYVCLFVLAAIGAAELCRGAAWALGRQSLLAEERLDAWRSRGQAESVGHRSSRSRRGFDPEDEYGPLSHADDAEAYDQGAGEDILRPVVMERLTARLAFVPTVRVATAIALVAATVALVISTRVAAQGPAPQWAAYNYAGYESRPAWPEYKKLLDTMNALPAGRALWEKNTQGGSDTLGAYGTDFALMMLPYWTHGKIASMEGLYYEASASTPYVFLTTAHVARDPSDLVSGLPYVSPGLTDFHTGVLQMRTLGVRYYMAQSSAAKQLANADPDLTRVASAPDLDGQAPYGWIIYEIKDNAEVAPMKYEPVVATGVDSPDAWLHLASTWYEDASALDRPVASDGPANWKRVPAAQAIKARKTKLPTVTVTHESHTEESITFDVSRVGVPIEVRTSNYPDWVVSGAQGPWRVTPNLMVVIPTSTHVVLNFERSGIEWGGIAVTFLSLLGLIGLVFLARKDSARHRLARARLAARTQTRRESLDPSGDDGSIAVGAGIADRPSSTPGLRLPASSDPGDASSAAPDG